ncbi:MAG: universal stress protein, partial [Chloroflexi bacterium]|nr:universal stress protein [Chloroflexota bacterium]
MFTKILVALDGSSFSSQALTAALTLAAASGCQLHLLHVIRDWALPKEIIDMMAAGEVQQSRQEIMEDSAELILADAKAQLQKAKLEASTTRYVYGDPATQIAAYAEEHQVDLIVLGHRGLGERGGLLGSVAR